MKTSKSAVPASLAVSGVTIVADDLTKNAIHTVIDKDTGPSQKEHHRVPKNTKSQGITIPNPTVVIDKTGNVYFEAAEEAQSKNFNTKSKESFIKPSKNMASEKESDVNVMLGVQTFPSMSQTALGIKAPQSFARKMSIEVESETGVASVQRQKAKSNIVNENQRMPSKSVGSKSKSLMCVYFPKNDKPLVRKNSKSLKSLKSKDSNESKSIAFSSLYANAPVRDDKMSTTDIPLRRTQSAPHISAIPLSENIPVPVPDEVRFSLRVQLEEIGKKLAAVLTELRKTEDDDI